MWHISCTIAYVPVVSFFIWYTVIVLLLFIEYDKILNIWTVVQIRGNMVPQSRLGAKVLGTSVFEYRFCSTSQYSVLILLKSTCTRTCTQVLLKIKVLLRSTFKYFTSTSHLKLIQNSSQTNHYSGIWNIQLMIRFPPIYILYWKII